MAVTISYNLVSRDLNKINLKISGEYDSALVSASLSFTDPLGVAYTFGGDLLTLLANATATPFEKNIVITSTEMDYPKTNFVDGSYDVNLVLTFEDDEDDVDDEQFFLFLNNAVNGWVSLFLTNINNCDPNKQSNVTLCREYIQASVELFRLTQFQSVRNLLLRAQDLADVNE
jgi:hypothetical protein